MAHWLKDKDKMFLVLPDMYGKEKKLSSSEVMGKYSLAEILKLKRSLPTKEGE
jgi:hypothetical protein